MGPDDTRPYYIEVIWSHLPNLGDECRVTSTIEFSATACHPAISKMPHYTCHWITSVTLPVVPQAYVAIQLLVDGGCITYENLEETKDS